MNVSATRLNKAVHFVFHHLMTFRSCVFVTDILRYTTLIVQHCLLKTLSVPHVSVSSLLKKIAMHKISP